MKLMFILQKTVLEDYISPLIKKFGSEFRNLVMKLT
jgi:hypothetical protein